jgi:hydroxyethylthiazole kinase-like uncharacterized protein yjeF
MHRVTPARRIPLHTIEASRRLERTAAAALPPHTLMQRAGLAVARLALALAPHARTIWIACGPGNNGGDGLEAAMHLQRWGQHPVVTWLGDEASAPEDARASLARARSAGVAFSATPPAGLGPDDLCIDALLGLGAARAPQGRMADWLRTMQASPAPVLAVDLPSGLNAETGNFAPDSIAVDDHSTLGSCQIQAQNTLSLLSCKPGLFTAHGRDAAGTVWFDDLGVVGSAEPACAWTNGTPPRIHRAHATHKGSHGDVAVVGGEGLNRRGMGMTGAALLAASAALHGGAGRVLVSLFDDGAMTLDPALPELMFRRFEALDLRQLTVVCGCGGGDAVRPVLPQVLSQSPRLVLDADALNAIAADTSLRGLVQMRARRGLATVLTPHPLEAARLLGSGSAAVQSDRLAAVRRLADDLACTVVLKGSGTLIATPGEAPALNLTGNARLGTAGTGDVLAGLIGARLAAGLAVAHQAEVDLASVQVDPADLHPHPRADGVAHATALAAQLLPRFVEAEVLAAQFGDVHQAFDVQASSVTKRPKLVAADVTTPLYSSPRCSRMYLHLSQASTSRLASSARRSLALQCRPAASQASWSDVSDSSVSGRLAALASQPSASAWPIWRGLAGCRQRRQLVARLARMALITRCTSRSG